MTDWEALLDHILTHPDHNAPIAVATTTKIVAIAWHKSDHDGFRKEEMNHDHNDLMDVRL